MTDTIPQRPSWREQLQAAFEAKQSARNATENTPPEAAPAAQAAPSPQPETAFGVTSPYAKPQAAPQEDSSETPEEGAAPAEPQGSTDDAFLSENEGDAAPIATLKAQLRSGFNRKMKELDDKIKALEGKSGDSASAQQKAQVLDALLSSPNPAEAIEAARQGLGIRPAGQTTESVFKPRQLAGKFKDIGLHEEVIEPIEDSLDAYMEAKLIPILMPYVAWIQQQAQKGAVSEWEAVSAKYGDGAKDFKNQAYQLAAKAQIPLEQALKAVLPDEVLVVPKAKEVERKVAAQTTRANGVAPNVKGDASYDAHRQALVKLLLSADREGGKKRFLENRIS